MTSYRGDFRRSANQFCGVFFSLSFLLWAATPAAAVTSFFWDDFESYVTDADVTGAGWTINDTAAVTETGTTWTITNPGGRDNPATADGTASTGNFIISDSDAGGGSNPTDSGASHDISTPSFSTVGGGGGVWLHLDTTAQLNNNGTAIFDIETSTDGGTTWLSQFERIAPGRTGQGAATRLPTNSNADGYYGHLDVRLANVENQNDVKVRFRQFEPNDDWFIAVDNVHVNDVAPRMTGGSEMIFWEDFSDNTLGGMLVDTITAGGALTWTTVDGTGSDERYSPGTVDEHNVNRLMHPTPKGGDPRNPTLLEFAIIDTDRNGQTVDDYLMTPVLDLSNMAEVFLEFTSEGAPGDEDMRVLLMRDTGGDGPDRTDAIVDVIFDYQAALNNTNEEPFYAKRIFDVSAAAGQDDVFFAFHWAGTDDWWWAVDDIHVSGNPVPEPSTLLLLGLGGVAVVCWRRR